MFTQSKLGSLLAAFGAVGGAIYVAKKGGAAKNIAITAVAAGLGGYILGNALTNYYATNKTSNF
jgi:hypothetical protein